MTHLWRNDSGDLVRTSSDALFRGDDCPCDCALTCGCDESIVLGVYSLTSWTAAGTTGTTQYEGRLVTSITLNLLFSCFWKGYGSIETRVKPSGESWSSWSSLSVEANANFFTIGNGWSIKVEPSFGSGQWFSEKRMGCDPVGDYITEYPPGNILGATAYGTIA